MFPEPPLHRGVWDITKDRSERPPACGLRAPAGQATGGWREGAGGQAGGGRDLHQEIVKGKVISHQGWSSGMDGESLLNLCFSH